MSKEMKLIPELRFPEFEKDGEWETESLGDVADVYQPKTISQTDLSEEGYPVYGANGIIGFYHEYNHETNQIAIACRGSSCGTVNFTKPKSWITGNAMVVNVDQFNKIDKELMFFQLDHANLDYLVTGSGQPQITGSIKKHEVFIPPLKEEQQKIASCLSSLDELIAAHKDKLDALKDHKKGLLQNLFPQEGERVPKFRFPEFENDGEWEEKKLGEILIKHRLGGNYENTKENAGIPLIKMGNIERGSINLENIQYLPINTLYNDDDILKEGDLLFNTRNTLELVGKVAIWRNELPFALYNSNLMRMTFDDKLISSNSFMNHLFNTRTWINKLKAVATGTTSVAAIYTKDLHTIMVSFPSKSEQQKIASCLSAVDDLIKAETEKIEALKGHKKGLMQGLFPKMEN